MKRVMRVWLKGTGPLLYKNGMVRVDPTKYPHLHAALERGMADYREKRAEWARVAELRRAGQVDSADRLARKLLGVQGPPMSEAKKAELRAYNEAHKDERAEKRRLAAEVRRRTKALLATGRKRVQRKSAGR